MNLSDLSKIDPRQALAIALGLSIALYALASNLGWVNRTPIAIGRWGRLLTWQKKSRIGRGLGEVARWLYYLGLPYATLILGYATISSFGIWGMDWIGAAIPFAILGIGALIASVWVWRPYARSEHPHALDESGWNWARHMVELIYQQAHWAFYRSAPILWLGSFYWGSFIGLGLILIEAWSNPFVRANARDITRADAPLWTTSLAIITTIIFVYTQNTWYALGVHLIIDVGLRTTMGFPRAHSPGDSSLFD